MPNHRLTRSASPPQTNRHKPGTLYIIGGPIGHLDDLTLRARRILRSVAIVATKSPRESQRLLAHHRIPATLTSYHWDNRQEKSEILLARLEAGADIALLTDCGTPNVYDLGAFLVHAAQQRGIRVVPIPGPSSLTAALSVSGLDGDRCLFVGSLPGERQSRKTWLHHIASLACTTVIFVQSRLLRPTLRALYAAGGNRPIVIMGNLTYADEYLERTSLAEAAAKLSRRRRPQTLTLVLSGETVTEESTAPAVIP